VAAEIQARIRCGLPNPIENLGKRPLEQSGKHHVNENDEEFLRRVELIPASLRGFDHRAVLAVLENDGGIFPSLRAKRSNP
jgi:hypothetical protein